MTGRTLTGPQTTASIKTIVTPIWFVQIGFTTPIRLTSGPTIAWNSLTWAESSMDVRGVKWGDSIGQSVTIELADPTQAYATLCSGQKLTGRTVQIWLTDASATAVGDPIAMPPMIGDNWSIPREYAVQMTAIVASSKSLPATQWIALLPSQLAIAKGTELAWNNGILKLN